MVLAGGDSGDATRFLTVVRGGRVGNDGPKFKQERFRGM